MQVWGQEGGFFKFTKKYYSWASRPKHPAVQNKREITPAATPWAISQSDSQPSRQKWHRHFQASGRTQAHPQSLPQGMTSQVQLT